MDTNTINNNTIDSKSASKTYVKASLWRIFFARAFDLLLTSIPTTVMVILYRVSNWESAAIVSSVGLCTYLLFFMFLPYIFKGNTLGKLIFNIRLRKEDSKITFKDLFIRESYFLLIPWFVQFIAQISIMLIVTYTDPGNNNPYQNGSFIALTIRNISYLFFMVWFIYIGVTIKLQEDNQAVVDMKRKIVVVEREALEDRKTITKEEKEIITRERKHIHLSDIQPGNIGEDVLKEIIEDDLDD